MSALAHRRGSSRAFASPVRGRDRSKQSSHVARPRRALLINAIQFCAWIAQAAPGDPLEYHRGLLAMDANVENGEFKANTQRELNRVARRAWWAAEQSLVHLVQRRNGPDDFSYLAIARPRPKELPATLSSVLLKEVA